MSERIRGSIFGQRKIKRRTEADEEQACDISALASRLFQLDAVIFHCRYLICLAGMQGVERSKGGQEGLMGIRQEGKQASKPQQKPQT